jgi:hypothetical protein
MILNRSFMVPLATLLASAALLACDRPRTEAATEAVETEDTPLPAAIQGMLRADLMAGPEAAEMLGRMHGNEVAPVASWVARYQGPKGTATMYLSRFADPGQPDSLLAAMSDSIGEGSAEFGHHALIEAAGRTIHSVLGGGQLHFFFVRNEDLIWLAIDPPLARAGLAEVLDISELDLPVQLQPIAGRPPSESDSLTADGAPDTEEPGQEPEEAEAWAA